MLGPLSSQLPLQHTVVGWHKQSLLDGITNVKLTGWCASLLRNKQTGCLLTYGALKHCIPSEHVPNN